jgi:predicted dehydrogenase
MSKKRILVVGTGSIGERHLRCLLTLGQVDVGLAEINEALRQKIAAQYKVTEAFASLDAALSARWDAAVICTPAQFHIPMAQQLADAGVHLLIEKPLSAGLDGIDRLIETVRARRLVVAVAYVHRAHPALTAMKAALDSGRFGRPLQLTVAAGSDFAFYRPAYRQTYFARRSSGGGAIQDALTHVFNAAEWLVGPIERIAADAAHQKLEGVDVEDTVHAIARHGHVLASYSLNQYQNANELTVTVVCEKGAARYDVPGCRWLWITETGGQWQEQACGPLERDDWFIRQSKAFLETLDGRRPPLCTLEEGLHTLKVNLAALASADSGGGMVSVR